MDILQFDQFPKQLPSCLKGGEIRVVLIAYWWCPLICSSFLQSLNMDQVPEKRYLSKEPFVAKMYPVNAI